MAHGAGDTVGGGVPFRNCANGRLEEVSCCPLALGHAVGGHVARGAVVLEGLFDSGWSMVSRRMLPCQ